MDHVCLQSDSRWLSRLFTAKGLGRLLALVAVLVVAVPARQASAAVIQQVQSGTAVNNANGIQTITISSVDMTKSVLIFQARSNSNRPNGSEIRGRLQTATTIEFERVTDNVPAGVVINIQWYLATFGSGVSVQRGETTQSAATVNVPITSVTSMSQAFVLYSKTPVAADNSWGSDDIVVGELTSATQLTFRANALNANHIIAWQVVQFTNAADINVQKGSITTMTGATLTATATLSPAVDVNKTFVLVGIRTTDGTTADIGARMVRAVLTNSTTITFDRSVGAVGSDVTEIVWQAVELKDASTVWQGSASFATGVSGATAVLGPTVNLGRAVGLISTQGGGGQNMGRSSYVGDDIPGVATATTSLAINQITLTRDNTVGPADVGWFVVQFDGGTGLKVGSFTKTATAGPVTQVIAHGLGQVPKAVILWTEGRTDQTFSTSAGIALRAAASTDLNASAATLPINVPAGTVNGDVMVAGISIRPNTVTVTPPAGWTLQLRQDHNAASGNPGSLYVYTRVAASEPASYTWSFSGVASTGSSGGIMSFSGVDATSPLDVPAVGLANTTAALTIDAPSVTTTTANTMLVTFHNLTNSDRWSPPTGMTEAIDVSSLAPSQGTGISMEGNWVAQAAVGASGTKTATTQPTAQAADYGAGITVALRASSPAYFGFGMTDGTTSKSVSASSENGADNSNAATQLANKALTIVKWDTATAGIVLAEADLQSWDSTNFTLNWTTNTANDAYVVHYIAIGGTSVSAKVLPWTTGTVVNAALGVTGVGFRPSVVLHANASYLQTAAPPATSAWAGFGLGAMDGDGNQWANGFLTVDNSATSDTQRGQRTDSFLYSFSAALAVQKKASFVSMDADGFTVNVSNATSANNAQVISLALAGLNAQVGSFNKSTAVAPATDQITLVNFQPNLVLLTSVQDLTQAGAPTAHSRFGIGASDGTTKGSSAFSATDGLAVTSAIGIDKTSKAFVKMNTNAATIDAEADLATMNADGFTLTWTTNDAVATEILYLAMAPMSETEVRLTSFTAAKYDRGVLLQWRTGYEIDNLGFNVYREINGVRTKVNGSLIAGSGLQAGQGGVVTSEHAYARWDLAASDPTAAYWLEDVEFNGKSTMHGPVTPVVSQLQEPATSDSGELGDIGNAANARRIFFASNPDPVQLGPRVVAPQVPPEVTSQWALAAQPTVKMGIRKPGWYRVTRDELVAAGLDPQVDPRTLQLFVDGTEQAIRVTGATAGAFNAGDAIEFYGAGVDTPYTDTRIYWLQAGVQAGRRIAVAARESSATSAASGFSSTLRRKDRSVYFAALRNGDTENWFGPMVYPQPSVEDPDDPWAAAALTLTPDHIDRSAVNDAQLTVALQGVTTGTDGNAAHRVGVVVNGTHVGEMTFVGQAHAEQTFPVSVGLLVDGENTVTLEARGGDADSSLIDAIRLKYPHTYQADADRLRFTIDGPGSIAVGGFAGSAIRVFDITDRTVPVELPATIRTDAAGLSTVTAHVPRAGPRTLMAFSDETLASPAFVQGNHPSSLHANTTAYDYVIISHADFITQVAPLAALRAQQGHRAVVVDVEDIYDEFSFGEKTPQALRDFLQWAGTNWATAPRFVVLAGDATTDPRDYEGLGNADFVPTKQVPMNQVSLETASDDWFVDFSGNGLPEIAIGRLSVRSSAQARDVVAKIVGYDQTGPQPWTKDVLLVADQTDDTANFERSSNTLSAMLPPDYRVHTAFRGALGDANAHQAISDAVNNGQLIVNYSGHGSTRVWGSNGQLLTNEDVPSWLNATRLPFVVAMNCLNGLFNAIYGEDSLAEALQRAPDGGAVAVWASSSVTPAATQALVNQELFRLIFGGTYATVGEAVAMAKRVVSNQDLRRSWIFFGDPAMRLNGAPQATTLSTLGAPPAITTQPRSAAIAAGQSAALSVIATGTAPLGYQWYARTSRTTMRPIAGATASSYTTPALTKTVSYMVRVSSPSGTTDSAVAVVSTPPAITTPDPWPAATARVSYTVALTATNGAPPYHWDSLLLPSGLKLDAATGEVFDAPNGAGTFTFDIRVTGADGVSTHKTFSLTVNAATDVLLNEQWHLQDRAVEVAGANVVPAWPLSRGAGVVIGIVDDGVQATHADLQANYLAALSYDFSDHDVDASPVTAGACGTSANCQGTLVAGIAAARGDNGFGGSGVAPLASLAGIRIAAHAVDADEAAAFSHQLNAVHIENHSWHRADDGLTLAAPGPLAEAALSSAIAQGRGGAGRIFVWAAGDGRASGDNCNFDGYANSRFGIAVGAVDDTGQQAPYSEACSALLVSAPSSGVPGVNRSLTTTDLLDADGSDAGDYTDAFGGTSAAAPVVSGVAALMLARNPALTWRDVQHILVRSSRQVDASDASWTFGPFPHSEKYGFGVVDALAAVTSAATWTSVPAERAVRAVTHAVGALIPDNNRAGVSDGIRIGSQYAGFLVEHVEVEFTAAHPHRGDLDVTLTSPAGIVSHLGTVRPGDGGANFAGWRFRSVRHWGESAAGTWILTVADRAAGSIGIFTGWTLRIYGTSTTPPTSGGAGTPDPIRPSAPGAPTSLTRSVSGTTVMPSWSAPTSGSGPTTTHAVEAGATSGANNLISARTGGTATSSRASGVPASNKIVATVPTAVAQPWSGPSGSAAANLTSAIESSLAPAGAQPVQATTELHADSTARLPDHAASNSDVFAGWYPGIYGAAPQPAASVPASARSAIPSPPGGEGGGSAPEHEPTPTPKPDPVSGPGAPTDLVASVSGSTIVLKWGPPTSGSMPTSYILEAGYRSGESNLFVSPTGSAAVSFTAKGAEAGTYFVRVRASNARGTSEPSNEAMVVVGAGDSVSCTAPPSAPSGLRLSVSGSTVALAWDAAKFGPTSYVVELGWGPGGNNLVVSDTGSAATTLTSEGVTPGTYFIRVRARNACGGSALSEKVRIVVR